MLDDGGLEVGEGSAHGFCPGEEELRRDPGARVGNGILVGDGERGLALGVRDRGGTSRGEDGGNRFFVEGLDGEVERGFTRRVLLGDGFPGDDRGKRVLSHGARDGVHALPACVDREDRRARFREDARGVEAICLYRRREGSEPRAIGDLGVRLHVDEEPHRLGVVPERRDMEEALTLGVFLVNGV